MRSEVDCTQHELLQGRCIGHCCHCCNTTPEKKLSQAGLILLHGFMVGERMASWAPCLEQGACGQVCYVFQDRGAELGQEVGVGYRRQGPPTNTYFLQVVATCYSSATSPQRHQLAPECSHPRASGDHCTLNIPFPHLHLIL